MDQFSMYLLYGAVMLIYAAYTEFRKPKEQRKVQKAALFLLIGLGYFVYAWYTRGAMLIAAAAVNMTDVAVGAALLLMAGLRAMAPPPMRNRMLAAIYGVLGLGIIAYGLGWL